VDLSFTPAVDASISRTEKCTRLVAALIVLMLASAGGARAQTEASSAVQVLLLTPTQAEDPAHWAGVVRGLSATGQRALEVADLPLDPVFAACRSADCAAGAASSAHVSVALFTFLPAEGSVGPQLELRSFEPDGKQTTGRASLASGQPLADVVTSLFAASRRQLALGEGALLSVASVPVGAVLWIDGQPAGVTPFEHSLPAGQHALRITLDGFQADEQTLALERGESRRVEARLIRTPNPALTDRAPAERATEASPWNFALGGVLALAGLPALVTGVSNLANDGQCLESIGDTCVKLAQFSTGDAVLLMAGALGLIGGGYLLIAQPFRVDAVASPDGAQLHVRGRF
jgi:hypothetical protein